ncbi:MAG: carboxymuconolactone decarboxylase family protein [Caulobacterales bacterium]|nr:carboxymuconolactone decarboxylase family protein [Caulobacterales bacterium]
MSGRLPPLPAGALPADVRAMIEAAAETMGFTPNDGLIMARRPDILAAFAGLVGAVYGAGSLDPGLKRLIGEAASKAAGCVYCTAHTAHGAAKLGVPEEKIAAVWEAETSPLFTDAERAAIRVAVRGAQSPSYVEDADMAALRAHFDEAQVVEIVAVIAMFGFLNRWNAIFDTPLEDAPAEAARRIGVMP